MAFDIRAVLIDNEGCLVHGKGLRFRNHRLAELQHWVHSHPDVHFGLATGRSVPYVEAMTQVLGLTNPSNRGAPQGRSATPCICETGAVLYWPWTDTHEILAALPPTDNLLAHLEQTPFRVELGKVACLSLYPEGGWSVARLLKKVRSFRGIANFEVSSSAAAVDITPKGINKGTAVEVICNRLGLSADQVLCIGDSGNDLSMRKTAGWFACPANATDECRTVSDYRSPFPATKGVLDILAHFVD